MEPRALLTALRRRWWLVIGLPTIVLVVSLVRSVNAPFLATTRATVLIPGDTEVPGNAERPELMVLDDVPELVRSRVFAEAVVARLQTTEPGLGLKLDQVHAALTAERYSRVLTIRAKRDRADEAVAIARAAAQVLPDAVNRYLVAAGGQPATVQVIDLPERAERGASRRALVIAVETLVALAAAAGIAAFAAIIDDRLYTAEDVSLALGLPVLADVRRRGRARSMPSRGRSPTTVA